MYEDAELARIRESIVDMQQSGGGYTGGPSGNNALSVESARAARKNRRRARHLEEGRVRREEMVRTDQENVPESAHRNRIHPGQRIRPLYTLKRDYSTKDRPLLPTETCTLYVLGDRGERGHSSRGGHGGESLAVVGSRRNHDRKSAKKKKKRKKRRKRVLKHERAIQLAKQLSRKLRSKSEVANIKESAISLSASLAQYRNKIDVANESLRQRQQKLLESKASKFGAVKSRSVCMYNEKIQDHPIFRQRKSPTKKKRPSSSTGRGGAGSAENMKGNRQTFIGSNNGNRRHRHGGSKRPQSAREIRRPFSRLHEKNFPPEDLGTAFKVALSVAKNQCNKVLQRPRSACPRLHGVSKLRSPKQEHGELPAAKTDKAEGPPRPTFFISNNKSLSKCTEIRAALEQRGWVEHCPGSKEPPTLLWTVRDEEKTQKKEMLENNKTTLYNHFYGNQSMTTKAGLRQSLDALPWIKSTDPATFVPSTYDIGEKAGREAVKAEFLLGASLSLLLSFSKGRQVPPGAFLACMCVSWEHAQTLCGNHNLSHASDHVANRAARPPPRLLHHLSDVGLQGGSEHQAGCSTNLMSAMFPAIENFAVLTKSLVSEGIPPGPDVATEANAAIHDLVLLHYDLLVGNTVYHVPQETKIRLGQLSAKAIAELGMSTETVLCELGRESLKPFLSWYVQRFPQLGLCKEFNTWIIKPSNSSRAVGVHLTRDLKGMLQDGSEMSSRVAQRYVERPFLIHGRKFDVRVWVLVTSLDPLQVYFYDSPYLRLCSGEYKDVDKSVNLGDRSMHLSNASVQNSQQLRYEKYGLPRTTEAHADERWDWENYEGEGNVWSKAQFTDYLTENYCSGGETGRLVWETRIEPDVKSIILNTLEACSRQMKPDSHRFELYGFDVLFDEKLKPWLLEVNLSPHFSGRTPFLKVVVEDMVEKMFSIALDKLVPPVSEAGTEATEQESTPAFAKRNEWGWCGEWGQITTVKPFGGEGSKTPQSQVSVPSSDMGVNGIALKWRHEQNLERVWLLTYSAVLLQRFMRRRWARREVPKPSISNATPSPGPSQQPFDYESDFEVV